MYLHVEQAAVLHIGRLTLDIKAPSSKKIPSELHDIRQDKYRLKTAISCDKINTGTQWIKAQVINKEKDGRRNANPQIKLVKDL